MVQAHNRLKSNTWNSPFEQPKTAGQNWPEAPANYKDWWSPEAEKVCELILSYSNLPEDWDTYGAIAPSPGTIKYAKLAVVAFDANIVNIKDAVPDAAGRITLSFTYHNVAFQVAIDEEEWEIMVTRPDRQPEFHTLEGSDPRHVHAVLALA